MIREHVPAQLRRELRTDQNVGFATIERRNDA